MMKLACALLVPLMAGSIFAASKPKHEQEVFRLHWDELAPLVVGNHIDAVLNDGSRVKGKALDVTPDALILDSRKTREVPRALVSVLRVTKSSATWRTVGVSVGTGVGLMVGIPAAIISGDGRLGLGIAVAGASLGYLAGHAADHQVRLIRVVQ